MTTHLSRRYSRSLLTLSVLAALLLAISILSLNSERYPLPTSDTLRFFAQQFGGHWLDPERHTFLYNLIVEIRLPRILAAIMIGAALSVSGAAFQGIFRNPLVSPDLLGVMSGAAFGAAIAITLGAGWFMIQVSAFSCGIVAVVLALLIAREFDRNSLVMLILGGIISSALFSALLSIVKFTADPDNALPSIVLWLMGSLAAVDLPSLQKIFLPMLILVITICLTGRWVDALAMGDDEAKTLGVPVQMVRYGIIICASLLGAISVSLGGIIGWVGLIVPHIARHITGPGNILLLPASALLGASFLLLADLAARSSMSSEIPIGIITQLIGIPVFLLVLHHLRRS